MFYVNAQTINRVACVMCSSSGCADGMVIGWESDSDYD